MRKNNHLGNLDEFPNDINEFSSSKQVVKLLDRCIFKIEQEGETSEALGKLDRVFNRTKKKDFVMAQEINNYIMTTDGGWFSSRDVYNRLQITTSKDKKNVITCLLREKDKGIIGSHPSRDGLYRRIMADCEEMNLAGTTSNAIGLAWPFQLEKLVDLYVGNVIVIAGSQNEGKTCFLLNFIKMNMNKFEMHYFNSELGEEELILRLSKFEGVDGWNFKAWERSVNFADVIKRDAINVIDFLEVTDNFFLVGGMISAIHNKLRGGLAVIAIQKSPGAELGRGASFGTEKPRLYITLDSGRAKIIKAKNWHDSMNNPNGLITEFSIINGAKLLQKGIWHSEF